MKVGFISLGCNKNLVDTEKTIAIFHKEGYQIVNQPEEADIIVINTCGFIESAKEEAINTILEMAEYKKEKCKYLIAMGCLVERYKEELMKEIPEVDLWIKYSEYDSLWSQISSMLEENKCDKNNLKNVINQDKSLNKIVDNVNNEPEKIDFLNWMDRILTTGNYYAYLKIADGCSNRCTYCAIPYIRGPQISRRMEDIIAEAEKLADEGYQEIILTAQDTTKYGTDIYGESRLAELIEKISEIEKIKWIRFLYAYPETIDDKLIQVVKENNKVCKYFDIPIQHIANPVLKRMNRQSDGASIRRLIQKLREEIPEVVIRTTVMVGFPGETEEDFEELYEFMKEAKFDKLGCFTYSKEDGTPAARLKEQIHPMTKKSRYRKIMSLQQKISKENLENKIGKKLEVLIEEKSFDGKYYIGRSYMDVPEIDGVVYVKARDNTRLHSGDFIECKVVDIEDYDLICELIFSNEIGKKRVL